MTDILKSNFGAKLESKEQSVAERAAFRARALESISGSMVFVEDTLLYWDINAE